MRGKHLRFETLVSRMMLSVSVDSPTNHEVTAGQGFGGSVLLRYMDGGVPGGNVSAVLLASGRHVLTAGHVVDRLDRPMRIEVDLNGDNVLDSSDQYIPVAAATWNPAYRNAAGVILDQSRDLAILELAFEVDNSVPRYEIYRDFDELGQVGMRVGYGSAGQGMIQLGLPVKKRFGVNRYEFLPNEFQVQYDFDGNGVNTLGDAGEGNAEVLSANRDSGSPVFLNGRIAGIAVGGTSNTTSPVYGHTGTDVRVSKEASWFDSILPPQVMNVTISGSDTNHAPFSFNGPNDATDFDGSGIQLRTVPVGGADTVSIRFSENMVNVASGSLTLRGLITGSVLTVAEFTEFNPATNTATWRFNAPFAAEQYLISLSDLVTDANNSRLDGEWTNPFSIFTTNTAVSEFPSGNGIAGGNFNFVFFILPGDADLNNWVNGSDYLIWGQNNGATDTEFVYADWTGEGDVDGIDLAVWSENFGRNLIALIFADFDNSGVVDGNDYIIWNFHNGSTGPHSDGDADGDGQVDGDDLAIWMRQFGLQMNWVM